MQRSDELYGGTASRPKKKSDEAKERCAPRNDDVVPSAVTKNITVRSTVGDRLDPLYAHAEADRHASFTGSFFPFSLA